MNESQQQIARKAAEKLLGIAAYSHLRSSPKELAFVTNAFLSAIEQATEAKRSVDADKAPSAALTCEFCGNFHDPAYSDCATGEPIVISSAAEPQHPCAHVYSRSINQPYPRHCIKCDEIEGTPSNAAERSEQQEWTLNGNWMDSDGCCKVCGGEIPYGHANNCDIWKLEKELAAERQRREQAEAQIKLLVRELGTIKPELLSALAAIEYVTRRIKAAHGFPNFVSSEIRELERLDVSLLYQHDASTRSEGWNEGLEHQRKCEAEVRKSLVDAIKDAVKSMQLANNRDARLRLEAALAQCKKEKAL